jgi:hypothetical protein
VRALLTACLVLCVSGCTLTVTDPRATDPYAPDILVNDISYRDLILIVYRAASTDPAVSDLVSLPPPRIGYEFKISGLKAEVRIRPVTGLNHERRIVAGHLVEYHLNGRVWKKPPEELFAQRIAPFLALRDSIEEGLDPSRNPMYEVKYADL